MLAHLYVIVTILGLPAMNMRWANDEMPSCAAALAVQNKATDAAFADPVKLAKLQADKPGIKRSDVVTRCEYHIPATLPVITDPVPLR